MTTQQTTSEQTVGAVPVACSVASAGLAAQSGRWQQLAARAMTQRTETALGVRISFRAELGAEDELRQLVAGETECCPWADWRVQMEAGQIVLDVRSAGEGIATLHSMFTSLHPAPSARCD